MDATLDKKWAFFGYRQRPIFVDLTSLHRASVSRRYCDFSVPPTTTPNISQPHCPYSSIQDARHRPSQSLPQYHPHGTRVPPRRRRPLPAPTAIHHGPAPRKPPSPSSLPFPSLATPCKNSRHAPPYASPQQTHPPSRHITIYGARYAY